MRRNHFVLFSSSRSAAKITLLLILSLCIVSSGIAIAHAGGEVQSKIQIPDTPQRIVIFPLFAEEMLLQMIGPDRIVGISHDYYENGEAYSPTMPLTEHIQGGLGIDQAEGILSLEPDLVVLYRENYYAYETLLPALEQHGVSVLFVDLPGDFDDVKDMLAMLGEAVGAEDMAAQMVRKVDNGLAQLAKIVANVPKEKRVRATHYKYMNPECYVPGIYDVIAHAAGVVSASGTAQTAINEKQLAVWNPDLITIDPISTDTDGSIYDISSDHAKSIANLREDQHLSSVPAIKSNHIYPLGIHHSQFMLQSAIELARLAYPDLFAMQGD